MLADIPATVQEILWYSNTAFNVLEFIIIIWVVRDRRMLVKNLNRMAEIVYELAKKAKVKPTSTVIGMVKRPKPLEQEGND